MMPSSVMNVFTMSLRMRAKTGGPAPNSSVPPRVSAVEHRPADVVAQPLVVEYELAYRLRELVTLPPAFASRCAVALAFRCAGARRLDRVGGRTELVRGDVRDDPGLASGVRGMPGCPVQVSGRGHRMAG